MSLSRERLMRLAALNDRAPVALTAAAVAAQGIADADAEAVAIIEVKAEADAMQEG